ncbi:transcriptional regulator [Vibrio sp. vnigr-6D03]|uniref:LysR family transcriptional regulator n=1 Tax=Vibrio sp. vnigr-6D03 TaxID=2058088 RepID=UPI000C32E65F|nr:LysR family transcriptional regulator [Vibrio sp. vnigr-6D03]PKF79556.1 transcriptional regulator [Vibrio sp. vnigr-6D03]
MDRFRQMTLFMNIVEEGSITNAANRLDLSKSVLSQHLKQLESDLKTTLLKRTTRKQVLTVAGQKFYDHCREMHSIANLAWEEVQEQQTEPSGKITVTAPNALMDSVVVPALVDAFASCKNVSLDLICSDQQLDLMEHDIDLAVRVGLSKDSSYKQKRIGEITDVLCRSKKESTHSHESPYVANHWQGQKIVHKMAHNQTGVSQEFVFTPTHRTNTIYQTKSLISKGIGIGLIPDILINEGDELVPVIENYHVSPTPVFVLHPFKSAIPISVSKATHSIEAMLHMKNRYDKKAYM